MEDRELALWVLAIFGALTFLLTVWRMLGWLYDKEKARRSRPGEVLLFTTDVPGQYPLGSALMSNGYNQRYLAGLYQVTQHRPSEYGEMGIWARLVFPVIVSDCQAVQIAQWINHPTQCEHYWHYGPDRPAGDPESTAKIKEWTRLAAEEEAKDPEKAKARQFYATTHGAGIAGLSQFPGFDGQGRPTFHNSSAYDPIQNPLGQRECGNGAVGNGR